MLRTLVFQEHTSTSDFCALYCQHFHCKIVQTLPRHQGRLPDSRMFNDGPYCFPNAYRAYGQSLGFSLTVPVFCKADVGAESLESCLYSPPEAETLFGPSLMQRSHRERQLQRKTSQLFKTNTVV